MRKRAMPVPFGANRAIIAAVTFVTAGVLIGRLAQSEQMMTSSQRQLAQQEVTRYQVVTKGLLANPTFSVQFRSSPLRLGIRDLMMGPGQAQGVPTPVRTLMELRGGGVTTIINGERQEHRPGDFWTVEKGSSFSLQNHGDVAVIRAIQLFEGGK